MVENATSFTGNGLRDWLIQRVTAVIFAAYFIFLLLFVNFNQINFQVWQQLFSNQWMKYGTMFALGALILHAWIGLWTILTDYVKPFSLRLLLEILVVLGLLGFFIWGFNIIWSV